MWGSLVLIWVGEALVICIIFVGNNWGGGRGALVVKQEATKGLR